MSAAAYVVWFRYSVRCPWLRIMGVNSLDDGEVIVRSLYRWRKPSPPAEAMVLPEGEHPGKARQGVAAPKLLEMEIEEEKRAGYKSEWSGV